MTEDVDSLNPVGWGALLFPVLALVVAFVVSILALDVTAALQHRAVPTTVAGLSPSLLAADEAGLWVVFVGAAGLGARWWGGGSLLRFVRFRMQLIDLPIGVLVGVLGQLVVVPLLYLPVEAVDPAVRRSISKPAVQLLGVGVGHDLLAVVVIIVVGAPLCEEIFFRGLTLRVYQLRAASWPTPLRVGVPVVASALLFAIAHFEPLQFLGLFVFGVILAIVVSRTGRLGASIVAHAAFNLTAVVALLGTGALVR